MSYEKEPMNIPFSNALDISINNEKLALLNTNNEPTIDIPKNSINDLIIQLNDASTEQELLHILEAMRSYSEIYKIEITPTLINYNFIPNLMNFYSCDNMRIQHCASLLVQSLSFSEKSDVIKMLLDNNFCDILFFSFPIENLEILEAKLNCLRNILIDFDSAKAYPFKNENALKSLMNVLTSSNISENNRFIVISILSLIMKMECEFCLKLPILEFCISCLNNPDFQLYWASLISIPTSLIVNSEISNFIFQKTDLLKICQEFLRSENEKLIEASIRCVGTHFLYNNTNICIDYRKIMKCALSVNCDLSYISLWLLSNAMASNSFMISLIEMNGNIYQILNQVYEGDYKRKCKIEACRCMVSLITQSSKEQIAKCLQFHFLGSLMQLIEEEENDVQLIRSSINSIVKLLRMPDKTLQEESWKQFSSINGSEVIENLISSENQVISVVASEFKKRIMK
ncbi:hypothetical protein TRFO_11302 [Tritrichomonas foetus]|uniref:Armadillo repeat-containing domain-containing protein n=1 Tax=Tritrichomonas foetus TaxID=1144522 RepID=A0A1J4JAD2_9EUKA|nr:hypothetical protein TRFO_11302 [Tritrichomonas foetus]|eukprot:OHS94220.1 hypothetical protein TRFO_11302 [Tritrichomonas foetus]